MVAGTAAAAEADAHLHVEDLQRRAGKRFVVLYSLYWRHYIAYYWGERGEGKLTLRAHDPDLLWRLMGAVAPVGWQANDLPRIASLRPAAAIDDWNTLHTLILGSGDE